MIIISFSHAVNPTFAIYTYIILKRRIRISIMSIASSSADVTPRQNNIPAEQNNTLSSSLPQLNNTVSGSNTNSQIGVFRTRATLDRRQSLELIKTNIKAEYSKQKLPPFSPNYKKHKKKRLIERKRKSQGQTDEEEVKLAPSSTSSTPRSIISKAKFFSKKLQAIQVRKYLHSNNFTKNQHSVLVDERNRLCKNILDKAEGKHLKGDTEHEKSSEKEHVWKQQGYLYEKHMMEVEATLDWLLKMKEGTATEADKPVFVTDVDDLLTSGDKEVMKAGGKSRLVQEKKPSFHVKDMFWSNSTKQRVQNKLDYYRDLERRRILDKNIKDYETAQLAEIAKKFGEDATILIDKLKRHKQTVFKMTKQYWRDRREANIARAEKLASTAKILREEELRKKQNWKTRTITKRKERARKKKEKEDRENAQRGWLKDLATLYAANIFRRFILNGRDRAIQMEREAHAQTCISRHWRIHHAHKENDKKVNALITLQKVTRGWQSRLLLQHKHKCADVIYQHLKAVGKLRILKKGLKMRHDAARSIQNGWKDRKKTLKKELNEIHDVFEEVAENEGLDVKKVIAEEIRTEVLNEVLRKKRVVFKDTTLAKYSFDYKNYNKKIARLREQSKEDPSAKALIYMVKKPNRPNFKPDIMDSEMRQALSLCMELKKNPKRWRARQARTKRWLEKQYEK